MMDLISRQAAIDVLDKNHILGRGDLNEVLDHIVDRLEKLPSAQPKKRTEERTETHGVCLDAIDRQAAIDAVENIDCSDGVGISALKCEAVDDGVTAIKALPSAQPEKVDTPTVDTPNCDDTISRQAVIEAINKIFPADPMRDDYTQGITCGAALANIYVAQLPSAQPKKRTEERTETHACDLISRQAAIDAILAVTGNSSVRELYEHVQEHELSDMWSGGVNAAIDIIIAVPSVQTESKETSSTHKALDTISRQDAIDFIDAGHLVNPNEPRWSDNEVVNFLKSRPSAQPDLSEYSDKLWKAAYERGKAEALDEIVRCKDCKHWKDSDGVYRRGIGAESKCPVNIRAVYEGNFYCADAERRTNEGD